MILRDPVHGLVSFDGQAGQVVARLLATREVQRLRSVRQLGLASLVFPGAEHSRFAHALGAAHVMVRLLERVRERDHELPPELRLDDEAGRDAVAAALLHDLGHGPFSHLFEEVWEGAPSHESWTIQVILDPATEVHQALEGLGSGMPGRVADLLRGSYRLGYLTRAVSGALDVDRCDYLLRDSHMTGVSYGLYDLDWLLRGLAFAELPGGEWVLAVEGRKGLPPIEAFFLGRHFMYQQVYHHKATRAAECLVRGIFRRVAELVQGGDPPVAIPNALLAIANVEPVPLGDYLELDDARLLSCFQEWSKGRDPVLADLTARLRSRRLPKTVPLPPGEGEAGLREAARARAAEVVAGAGLRADLHVWLDQASDTPYNEPADDGHEGLWVMIRHQPMRKLSGTSFLLGELCGKRIETARLVFPEETREAVLRALDGVLA